MPKTEVNERLFARRQDGAGRRCEKPEETGCVRQSGNIIPIMPTIQTKIQINSIDYNGSLVNGPGVRTLVFLNGCDIRCESCHNRRMWDKNCGTAYEVSKLAVELKSKVHNKKVTITGGEPFFQQSAVTELTKLLYGFGFDICLYTGSNLDEVPKDIFPYLKYIKVGKYKKEARCTTKPYIGSTNQEFIIL